MGAPAGMSTDPGSVNRLGLLYGFIFPRVEGHAKSGVAHRAPIPTASRACWRSDLMMARMMATATGFGMKSMNDSMTLTARHQPAHDGIGCDTGNHQCQSQAPPETKLEQACIHRTGDDEHDRVIDNFHDRDRGGIRGKCQLQGCTQIDTGPQQGNHGQGVTKKECQYDRERDGRPSAQSQRCADHHTEHFSDSASGQAVNGRT